MEPSRTGDDLSPVRDAALDDERLAHVDAVTVFVDGDARDVNTWSGLPQGCVQGLEGLGVTVHAVDTYPGRSTRGLLRLVHRLCRHLRLDDAGMRDAVLSTLERRAVARGCRRHRASQCQLFLTYSFSGHHASDLPTVHYCDQTFAQLVESRGNAALTAAERRRSAREEATLRRADRLLSTSTHGIEFLRRHYGLGNVCGTPVYGINLTGYPPGPFLRRALSGSKRSVVFVGSSVEGRGLDVLLEAFLRFSRSAGTGYTLDIVGVEPGSVPGEWPHTRWHGRLDKSHPAEAARYWRLLREARMFVIPSRSGPQPGVVLEAQYAGTPVIVTSVWGSAERVQHEKTGLVLDEPTPTAVYEAMCRLEASADLWDELSRAGHENALRWTWDVQAPVLLEQLRRAAAYTETADRQGGT